MRALMLLAAFAIVAGSSATVMAQTPPSTGIAINRNSGMCVGPRDASGSSLEQRRCLDLPGQQWNFSPVAGGHRIVGRTSALCLEVDGSSLADGASVLQRACTGLTNQTWTIRPRQDWSEVVALHSGKCLTVTGSSIDDGAALIQSSCSGGASQEWTLSPPAAPSLWSEKATLPLVPVAAALLRNGKVLAWSAYDRFTYGNDHGQTYTTIYDPDTGKTTERLVANTGHDMFCPGTAILPDGRILVNGGSSAAKTSIYDPSTRQWSAGAEMNVPRGYQGDTVLSTGEVLTIGGSWSGGAGGKYAEAWTQDGGWRAMPNVWAETLSGDDPAGLFRGDNHMWLFAAPDGAVFHAGPSSRMHWVSTVGAGAIVSAGSRGEDAYSMNGNIAMYDGDKLLKAGGAPAYEEVQANDQAYAIDFSAGPTAPVAVTKQKPMAFPRAFANAVVLPNGQVVVVGGMNYPVPFSDARSVMIPEIWTPETGAFTRLAVMQTPRNYHSVALLLSDGRVLVGGGGLCGSCAVNHPNVEILTPPYLLNPDGSPATRPVIAHAPKKVAAGDQIRVTTESAVSSFALVRLSAVTHSVNNDQRRLVLPIIRAKGTTYRLSLPADRSKLIAGDWLLFAMTANGTPSLGRIVRVR